VRFMSSARKIVTGLTVFGYLLLSACNDGFKSSDEEVFSGDEFQQIINDLASKAKLPRNENYKTALDVLDVLGVYTFDPDDLQNCENENLQSYYLRRQLPSELVRAVRDKTNEMNGEQLFQYMLHVSEMTSEDIEGEFKCPNESYGKTVFDDTLKDNLVTHLIWLASERGSIDALNEIGASQIYCYQGTGQDVEAAVKALKTAADQGDMLAMLTLGKIYYSGTGGFDDPELGKKLQDQAFEEVVKQLRDARINIE